MLNDFLHCNGIFITTIINRFLHLICLFTFFLMSLWVFFWMKSISVILFKKNWFWSCCSNADFIFIATVHWSSNVYHFCQLLQLMLFTIHIYDLTTEFLTPPHRLVTLRHILLTPQLHYVIFHWRPPSKVFRINHNIIKSIHFDDCRNQTLIVFTILKQ